MKIGRGREEFADRCVGIAEAVADAIASRDQIQHAEAKFYVAVGRVNCGAIVGCRHPACYVQKIIVQTQPVPLIVLQLVNDRLLDFRERRLDLDYAERGWNPSW